MSLHKSAKKLARIFNLKINQSKEKVCLIFCPLPNVQEGVDRIFTKVLFIAGSFIGTQYMVMLILQ